MVEVTKEDRDAAADILDEISSLTQDDGIGQVADLIRDGEYDEHDTVQRTARHRQAGVQQAIANAVDDLAELKTRITPQDWRTICAYVMAEREQEAQAIETARAAGVQQGLDMAAGVAKNERLAEPQDETDWAYESAIDDVLAAIRKLGGSDGTD